MSDYAFLRTGLLDGDESAIDTSFLRMVTSILKVLMHDAIETAVQFAETCGRRNVRAKDTVYALKYQARVFFDQPDLETKVLAALAEENEHTYDTEDDGSDDNEASEDDNEASDDDVDETDDDGPYCVEFVKGDAEFHRSVVRIDADWDAWTPTDPVKAMLKRAIDATALRCLTT